MRKLSKSSILLLVATLVLTSVGIGLKSDDVFGFSDYSLTNPQSSLPASGWTGRTYDGGGGSNTTSIGKAVKQGWTLDGEDWYYYSGTTRDTLKKGWHHDFQDGRWYYLDLSSGVMLKGWQKIDGAWYYFNPYTSIWTWEQRSDGEWYYKAIPNSRPLGSMYANEKTSDGYTVDVNGVWKQ